MRKNSWDSLKAFAIELRKKTKAERFLHCLDWSSLDRLQPHHWASNETIANHLFQVLK